MAETLEEHELIVPDDSTALAQQPVCDIDTVQQAQSGDKEAFTKLFMQTYRAMYFAAKSVLSNDEDIYDALQIGYTKAYKYITRLSTPEKFYPWLHTIIHNAALDVLKDVLAYAADEFTETADTKDAQTDAERRADLRRVLAKMDPSRAQVLTLHYYDGLSLAEIARMLGQPASTVRSRLQAAKNELRALLTQSNIDENLYGGSIAAMIVTSLRSLIGTDILSTVVAQDMLDNILAGKTGRLEQAVYKMMQRQRDRRVKRLAATLLAVCIGVAALTTAVVFALIGERSQHALPAAPSSAVSSSNTSSRVTTSALPSSTQTTLLSTTTSGRTTSKSSTTPTSATTTTKADTFVHDYREGHANTIGNHPNNLSLGRGRLAKQDNWLYYSHAGSHFLSKIKTDGSGYQIISEHVGGFDEINVIGDWIYYNGNVVCRMRTDGSERTVIFPSSCSYLSVNEDVGYFIPIGSDTLYRFDTKTLTVTKHYTFTEPHRSKIAIQNNILWYISFADRHAKLISRDLSSPTEIRTQTDLNLDDTIWSSFFINENTLYYINNTELYSIDIATSSPMLQKIADLSSPASQPIQFLYYSPDNGGTFATLTAANESAESDALITVFNANGKALKSTRISHEESREYYCFDDGYVYYHNGDYELCRATALLNERTIISK